jgi:hypothetical protein
MVCFEGEWNITMASTNLAQQKQVEKVVEEYTYIFTSPGGVPLHCQVKHLIDLIPDVPLPNSLVYRHYPMENEEIKCQIKDLI